MVAKSKNLDRKLFRIILRKWKFGKSHKYLMECLYCHKTFKIREKEFNIGRIFCSCKCKGLFFRGRHLSPSTEFQKGKIPWNKNLTIKIDSRIKGRKNTGKLIECPICKKSFYVPKCYLLWKKYCSKNCYGKSKIGHFNPKTVKALKNRYALNEIQPWNKNLTKETDSRIKSSWNKGLTAETDERMKKFKEIGRRNWKNPEFINKIRIALNLKPNKAEKYLLSLLNNIIPNEYEYVGDLQFILGGKCPDFLNINGKKKLIELFGDYWHSKKRTGIELMQHELRRINHFKNYGFDTLIIWEKELSNLKNLINKIKEFTYD